MIFSDLMFHNVSELTPDEKGGYLLHRLPLDAERACWQGAQDGSKRATGCEIRFVPLDEEVTITLACDAYEHAQTNFLIYDGSFHAGWRRLPKILTREGIEIKLGRPYHYEALKRLHEAAPMPFSPDVIRILLPSHPVRFLGVTGAHRPPRADELPQKTYFAYGSSITNGSSANGIDNAYTFRVAEALGYDRRLLAFPGSARLEMPQARTIANIDFDIATVEMGINMIHEFSCEEFEARAREFLNVVVQSHPNSLIFCIDLFYSENDLFGNERLDEYRAIVRRVTEGFGSACVIHIDGRSLLGEVGYLTADLVHPTSRGHAVIATRLLDILRSHL